MRVSAQERVDTAEFAARRERLCQAAGVWAGAVAEAIKGTLPGMYEYRIAAAQYVNTRMGAGRGVSAHRPRRAARADRALLMDHTRQRQAGELVYYGLRLGLEYYTSDITHTWAVSGRFTAEHEGTPCGVLKARNAIIAAMKTSSASRCTM
jgi:Xaa-Pro aminopeptidase